MKTVFAGLAVLFVAAVCFADTTTVTDTVIPQKTIIVAEHIEYPVWRYTGDSTIKRLDVIAIRFLWRRQGGTTVKDTTMKWRPVQAGVNADSVKPFLKFNTSK